MPSKWKSFLCRIFGHRPRRVRRMVHDGTCKKPHPRYYSPRDYGRGHYVTRIKCKRCGKVLKKNEFFWQNLWKLKNKPYICIVVEDTTRRPGPVPGKEKMT